MAIKMIVSDLDETLLNEHSQITPRTENALKAAMACGVLVVLASGRMVRAMRPFANQIGVNAPIIAFNGAATYDMDTQSFLHQLPVSAAYAREVCEMAERMGVYIQAFLGDQYYFESENMYNRRYAASIGVTGCATGVKLSEYVDRDAAKLLIVDEPERINQLVPKFSEYFTGRVNCLISRPIYIECTGMGADKGNALRALAAQYGIQPEEIAAFGDAQNDLTMLRYAGYGYAVENARPEVKAEVQHIAPANTDDGVAQTIEKWLRDGLIAGGTES